MTVEITDYMGQAKAKFAEAKALLSDPNTTAEDPEKIDGLIAEAKGYQVKAEQLSEVTRIAQEIEAKSAPDIQTGMKTKAPDGSNMPWEEYIEALGVAFSSRFTKMDKRLKPLKSVMGPEERKDLVESVGASGGFLVPTEFYAQLQALAPEISLVRGRATTIRMRRRAFDVPVLNQTGTTAGIGHWFGGMQFYWTEEASSKAETNASFKKITLVAHKLTGPDLLESKFQIDIFTTGAKSGIEQSRMDRLTIFGQINLGGNKAAILPVGTLIDIAGFSPKPIGPGKEKLFVRLVLFKQRFTPRKQLAFGVPRQIIPAEHPTQFPIIFGIQRWEQLLNSVLGPCAPTPDGNPAKTAGIVKSSATIQCGGKTSL